MLTHHRRPACLSLISTDLPILSTLETSATLYQKDRNSFHVLLNQSDESANPSDRQLLWLEISPFRVIMTKQGSGAFAYRHFWEKGVFGISRYWINSHEDEPHSYAFRLRNYTRNLKLEGDTLPEYLRLEYELWTGNLQLGHYVLHLEIYQ